ncbi:MAG: hypothetical protein ACM3N0_02125 [Chloroflexota bacterium]
MRHLTFRLRFALAALAFAALPAFGGCGGGNSDSTSTQAVLPSSPGSHDSGGQADRAGKKRVPGAKQRNSKPNPPSGRNGAKKSSSGNSRHGSDLTNAVKELVAGNRKAKVVASPKAIRKIIKELKEGSHEQGESASPTQAVEEILGRMRR